MRFVFSFFILLSFLNIQSHAAELSPAYPQLDEPVSPTETNNKSYYESLIAYFNSSEAQTPSVDLKGWWAGRCYRKDKPATALPGILVIAAKGSDDGPLFPGNEGLRISMGIHNDKPLDFFDTLDEEKTALVNKYLKKYLEQSSKMRIIEGSLVSQITSLHAEYQLRSYQDQLVGLASTLAGHEMHPEGAIQTACYYFKSVTPSH